MQIYNSPIKSSYINSSFKKDVINDVKNINFSDEKITADLNALASLNMAFLGKIDKTSHIENFNDDRKYLPKYLYHFTTLNNYNNMLKSGKIITGVEQNTDIKGIFTVDMNNFINNWGYRDEHGMPLDEKLIKRIALCNDGNVVLLRIPTEKLDPSAFKVRSQNVIFDMFSKVENVCNSDWRAPIDIMVDDYPDEYSHMNFGVNLSNAQEFLDNNHALEYIYQKEIPITDVALVASANLNQITGVNSSKQVSNLIQELFKNENNV